MLVGIFDLLVAFCGTISSLRFVTVPGGACLQSSGSSRIPKGGRPGRGSTVFQKGVCSSLGQFVTTHSVHKQVADVLASPQSHDTGDTLSDGTKRQGGQTCV